MTLNCRICFEEDIRDNLISPCLCSGHIKYVHRACLDNWRNIPSTNNKNFNSCEICNQKFILEIKKNLVNDLNLNLKYKLYIGFEVILIILILLIGMYFIGNIVIKLINQTIVINNNQIINEIVIGLIASLILCAIVGYIAIIHSNQGRLINHNELYHIDNTLCMKLFILIVVILGLLFIIYYIITYLIAIRKKYFFDKQLSNIDIYIVKDRS
jgi:E3 ubiquitin-protein ligase DOA10